MHQKVNEWMNKWMDKLANGQTDGWANKSINQSVSQSVSHSVSLKFIITCIVTLDTVVITSSCSQKYVSIRNKIKALHELNTYITGADQALVITSTYLNPVDHNVSICCIIARLKIVLTLLCVDQIHPRVDQVLREEH